MSYKIYHAEHFTNVINVNREYHIWHVIDDAGNVLAFGGQTAMERYAKELNDCPQRTESGESILSQS